MQMPAFVNDFHCLSPQSICIRKYELTIFRGALKHFELFTMYDLKNQSSRFQWNKADKSLAQKNVKSQ